MLTNQELVAVARAHMGERVLSVYVDGRVTDPVARDRWRRRVDDDLRALRAQLASAGAPREEREAFDRAASLLGEQLPASSAVGAPGWAGFATADRVVHVAALPVSPPPRVTWSVGPYVAPYVRALHELQPVIVAVADSVRTRLYRQRAGALERLDVVESERHERPPSHMGSMPRAGFHTGTRGATGVDAAERRRLAALRQMATTVATRLASLAGADGWIVVGGTPESARAVHHALPAGVASRALLLPALHDGATEAELARAADEGAAALRNARDLEAVTQVLARAGAAGRGAVGAEATRQALDGGAVQALYFTPAFLERHADDAESVVRAAMAQQASVVEVAGDAAARLDRDGAGIAARLRFGRGGVAPTAPAAQVADAVTGAPVQGRRATRATRPSASQAASPAAGA